MAGMIRIDTLGYPILIGRGLFKRAATLLPRGRHFLVADQNVASAGWLGRLDIRPVGVHFLKPGEENKNLRELESLLDAVIEAKIERGDHVVALGGGLVGDMAGFAAAILKRGCGVIQIPTTLLAQADSAVGGKTGINARQGKNLIGAFHQPDAVLIDVATLESLPERELRAGYAEVVKYGLIADADFFGWCEANGAALLAGDEAARLHAIEHSVRAKAALVARDERDTKGRRALLNFGHSFAHAIEAETGLPHGEAVSIGMSMAFRLSAARGFCPTADVERVMAHLDMVQLPTRLPGGYAGRLLAHMLHDKKRARGRLRLVLTRGIGRAFLDDALAEVDLRAFLDRDLA